MEKHVTILCDFNYLHYALVLLGSIDSFESSTNLIINFLCLDDRTFNIISNIKLRFKINCYKEEVILNNQTIINLKTYQTRYYFWALASYFSNYIMSITPNCSSVMYIDSDIVFHKDINILYETFGEKDIGIFKHRFDKEAQLNESGKFNVGIVYFKNSSKGKEVLHWWTDAVLYKKYAELQLHTCGDQKYLDHFPVLCSENEIYIDDDIGHGAPWNWGSYNIDNIANYEITYKGKTQPLVFTHFSKFKFEFKSNSYCLGDLYRIFTNNNQIYKNVSLKKIHDDYFRSLKKVDKIIKSIEKGDSKGIGIGMGIAKKDPSIKIAVGIIVFEGDYVFKQCIDQIYPYVDQILITEGPVRFWQNLGKTTSTDNTNKIMDNYNDYDNKIKIIHGQFEEKTEECNSYIPFIRNDIDYLWQIDSDELYTIENIMKIKKMLIEEKPTSVGVRSCTFYGGFDSYLTGFEQNNDNFLRIFKYMPGSFWQTHRPPTIQYPVNIPRKHISSDELFNKWGIQMHHYSYVFPSQVKNKMNYYANSLNIHGIIPDYYKNVYLNWISNTNDSKKMELENKYYGVHEFKPERRGPCFTTKFINNHPESIIRDLSILNKRFDDEKINELYNVDEWKNVNVPMKQLGLNIEQLNSKNNYPPHWKNLLNSFTYIDSILSKNFNDIACGVGSTYKLLLDNQFNMKYYGSDFSEAMINTAKKTWNDNCFKEQDVFKLTAFNKNDIVYVDGLLDMLPNAHDCLNHILHLNSEYVILNRINISETNKISIYRAYDLINVIKYSFEEKTFLQIINDNNYKIIYTINSLFLLQNKCYT